MPGEESESAFKITDRRHRSGDDPADRATASPGERPAPPPPSPPIERTGDDRSLVGLFMMLGESAVVALGESDPRTGQPGQPDLPTAAELIDTLALLRDRTDGRRTGEETQVLEDLLYTLQLRYVSATKHPG